jgi:hypothetical protein
MAQWRPAWAGAAAAPASLWFARPTRLRPQAATPESARASRGLAGGAQSWWSKAHEKASSVCSPAGSVCSPLSPIGSLGSLLSQVQSMDKVLELLCCVQQEERHRAEAEAAARSPAPLCVLDECDGKCGMDRECRGRHTIDDVYHRGKRVPCSRSSRVKTATCDGCKANARRRTPRKSSAPCSRRAARSRRICSL